MICKEVFCYPQEKCDKKNIIAVKCPVLTSLWSARGYFVYSQENFDKKY